MVPQESAPIGRAYNADAATKVETTATAENKKWYCFRYPWVRAMLSYHVKPRELLPKEAGNETKILGCH